jgi:hypothetical protein
MVAAQVGEAVAVAGPHQARLVGEDDGVDAVSQFQLGEDPFDVGLDGRLLDHERPADLQVGQSVGDEAEDVAFPGRELLQPAGQPGVGPGSGGGGELLDDGPGDLGRQQLVGTTEKWTIRARNVEHPFHIHLAPFQVIGRDGDDRPGRYDRGWKDTVSLGSGGRAELLIRFDGYRGKYVLHCHNLEHEDMMMMANFEVV